MKTIEFKGIVSGDGESFCFDVDRETFKNVTGKEPEVYDCKEVDWESDEPKMLSDLFRLYPNDIFIYENKVINVKVEIR